MWTNPLSTILQKSRNPMRKNALKPFCCPYDLLLRFDKSRGQERRILRYTRSTRIGISRQEKGKTNMRVYAGLALGLCLTLPVAAFGDFRYEETTQVTGGSIINMTKAFGAFSKNARQMTDPTKSTILVKGNRMARINQDATEIIDLDQETITRIDHDKKQYSVTTFQEMKAAMEEAMQKAAQPPSQPQRQTTPSGQLPEMHFKVSVNNTGQNKEVAGLSAAQSILKMTMEAKDQRRADREHGYGQRYVDGVRRSRATSKFAISTNGWPSKWATCLAVHRWRHHH